MQRAFGPWRRSGEWWSAEVWSREEWDIEAAADSTGVLMCVVAHDLLGDRWLLEAFYD